MSQHSRRVGMLLLLLAAPVFAQFAELATTDDGSQLYFTTEMLPKGAKPGNWRESRLFRFGPAGVTLYAERGALAPEFTFASHAGATHPSVSGDGAVVSVTYGGLCRAVGDCDQVIERIEVRGRETLDLGSGQAQVSRNGRWLLVASPSLLDEKSTLVELDTGRRAAVPFGVAFLSGGGPSPVALASDGSFLVAAHIPVSANSFSVDPGIWKDGKFTRLSVPGLAPFALSDDGATVLATQLPNRLVTMTLASRTQTIIVSPKNTSQTPAFLSMSNNARRVLYTVVTPSSYGRPSNTGPAFLWDAADRVSTGIPLDPDELATSGVLSGDGSVAFVATTHSRIVKWSVGAATVTSLFPQTPYCDDPSPIARGSFTRLRCSFSASAAELQGKIAFSGTPVPILSAAREEIWIQVPWQTPKFAQELSMDIESPSPFQSSQELQAYDGAPRILESDSGLFGMNAIKGDWSGRLTSLPESGEPFHIYMTGLGWPKTEETTGVPASLSTPNPIQWKLSCRFLPGLQSAELLFAGLAPGKLGIYQTTFRMPDISAGSAPTSFRCRLQSPAMGADFGPGLPPQEIIGRFGFATAPATPPLPPY